MAIDLHHPSEPEFVRVQHDYPTAVGYGEDYRMKFPLEYRYEMAITREQERRAAELQQAARIATQQTVEGSN